MKDDQWLRTRLNRTVYWLFWNLTISSIWIEKENILLGVGGTSYLFYRAQADRSEKKGIHRLTRTLP